MGMLGCVRRIVTPKIRSVRIRYSRLVMNKQKYCPKCEKDKDEDEFSKNKNSEDGLGRVCKVCMAAEQSKSYNKNKKAYQNREKGYVTQKKEKLNTYKSEKGCEKCGDKRFYVLVFHHINSKEKEFNLSQKFKNYSWKIIFGEIMKCKILCHNFHYEFHHLERQNKITIEEYLAN